MPDVPTDAAFPSAASGNVTGFIANAFANQWPCKDPNGEADEGRLAFPSGQLERLSGVAPVSQSVGDHRCPQQPALSMPFANPHPAGHTSLCFVLAVYASGYL